MERSWFFNNGEQYGQDELRKFFTHIYRDGVSVKDSTEMDLAVTVSEKALVVGTGFAIIGGFAYENDEELSFSISADSNFSRIDRVILRLDVGLMKINAVLKKGVAASAPKPPDLERDNVIYELSLAQVKITPSGAISVVDERADQNVCGAIRPRNLTELEIMMQTFQKRFEDWFNSQQAVGWRNIFFQEETPEGAVSGSLWL